MPRNATKVLLNVIQSVKYDDFILACSEIIGGLNFLDILFHITPMFHCYSISSESVTLIDINHHVKFGEEIIT